MNDISLNILTFPLWWYTTGFSSYISWAKKRYHYHIQKTGLLVFARHIKEPLYGDYTKSGIIISFFARIILLVFKLLFFAVYLLFLCLLGFLYLLLLPLTVTMVAVQILGL